MKAVEAWRKEELTGIKFSGKDGEKGAGNYGTGDLESESGGIPEFAPKAKRQKKAEETPFLGDDDEFKPKKLATPAGGKKID